MNLNSKAKEFNANENPGNSPEAGKSKDSKPQSGDSFKKMMMDQRGVAYRSASKRGNCGKIGLGSEDKASFRLKIQIWVQAWARQIELILAQARVLAYPRAIPIRLGLNNIWPGPAKLLPYLEVQVSTRSLILLYSMKSKERT